MTLTIDKLKHLDPYYIKVAIGAQLNEQTKVFTEPREMAKLLETKMGKDEFEQFKSLAMPARR